MLLVCTLPLSSTVVTSKLFAAKVTSPSTAAACLQALSPLMAVFRDLLGGDALSATNFA